MSARTGKEYLEGLKDDREIWIDGKKVNLFEHPAFQGSLKGMAGYFDWQHKFADKCLVKDEVTGDLMTASLILPKNKEDLEARAKCFEQLARYSNGMLGRTPDYCNVALTGYVSRVDAFINAGHKQWAENLLAFHREVLEKDLSLTHTIIQPQPDKSIPDLDGLNGEVALQVIERRDDCIVVSGAKILATLGPFADELFVYPSAPITSKGTADHALMFSVPVNTKGIIMVCRDHYEINTTIQNAPFSSRFDEQDAYVIFDRVEVPLNRVFMDGDLEFYNKTVIDQLGRYGNITQQTAIRAAVKLEFAYDLCHRMAQIIKTDKKPEVIMMLGEIWSYSQLTRSSITAGLNGAHDWGNNAFFFDESPMRALIANMPAWMIRTNDIIKIIGSHNLLATPTIDSYENPDMKELLEKYMPSANGCTAKERAQIFRIAWDFAGSALGGRVELYERYYLTSQQRNQMFGHVNAQKNFTWNQVEEFMINSGIK
jgi:aromatic ring hydroxylase